ncbi:MAG: hypothetical protein VKJ06_03850, partial [Vampirovibrionales bacterium]|nr:hypothetical protein [Vampirovibrionales bacterium]
MVWELDAYRGQSTAYPYGNPWAGLPTGPTGGPILTDQTFNTNLYDATNPMAILEFAFTPPAGPQAVSSQYLSSGSGPLPGADAYFGSTFSQPLTPSGVFNGVRLGQNFGSFSGDPYSGGGDYQAFLNGA